MKKNKRRSEASKCLSIEKKLKKVEKLANASLMRESRQMPEVK